MHGFLENWLRGVNAYEDCENILEHIGLEQFFNSIPSGIKLWIQDRPDVVSVQRAADYADEYYSRHENAAAEIKSFSRNQNRSAYRSVEQNKATKPDVGGKAAQDEIEKKSPDKKSTKAFEARKPIVCYRCNHPGHLAVECRVPKVSKMNLALGAEDELLKPYLYDMMVNGQSCKVLRDTGATHDLAHS